MPYRVSKTDNGQHFLLPAHLPLSLNQITGKQLSATVDKQLPN